MADGRLIREANGPVAVLRFDRPRLLNAFTPEMFEALACHLEAAGVDDSVRAVVITGEGRAFSAGIDLRGISARVAADGAEGERDTIDVIQRITRVIAHLPKVVVAAVNGPAIGFGAELAVAADVRIAGVGASFSFPEVQRALFATGGSTRLLPQLVGVGRATEWLFSGRTIPVDEALASGLVTRLVADEDLLEEAIAEARRFAGAAPVALRRLKRLLREGPGSTLEQALRSEVEGALDCLATKDFEEGIRSFVERRPPRFTGD